MKKRILLGSITFSAHVWLPYSVGCLISHCLKNKEISDCYEFMEPEYRSDCLDDPEFHKTLKSVDMLGLTNWVWNQTYNDRISKLYKSYRPDGIVIYGGLNVPEELEVGKEYASHRPFVDIFFCGPAEITFENFLKNFNDQGISSVRGTFTHTDWNVISDKYQLTQIPIPTPYLDGIFDGILDKETKHVCAVVETNRGCPYACSFCDWGGLTRSKIIKLDNQKVMDTITRVFSDERIDQVELADANMGIFPEDVDYMQHMASVNKTRKSGISLTMGGFAKNGSAYTEKIMRIMHESFTSYHGRKYVKLGFQSHDPTVLEVAQRTNIKNEKLYPMIERFLADGIEVDGEIIMGMPGDNFERWLHTVQTTVDLKINHMKGFVLYMLPNTPMATKKYREKYDIVTKKLIIPYDLDAYLTKDLHRVRLSGKNITSKCDFLDATDYQTFEFIYSCFSFDSEELMKILDVWFWFNTFWNAKIARKWMMESNESIKDQYLKFINLIERGELPFLKTLLDDFRYCAWNTIAKPEPTTIASDLKLAMFVSKFSMRMGEVVDIYLNQQTALSELQKLYPSITFDHFNQNKTDREIIQLYFLSADVTS